MDVVCYCMFGVLIECIVVSGNFKFDMLVLDYVSSKGEVLCV